MANAFTPLNVWRFAGGQGKDLVRIQGTLVIDTTASGGAAPDDLPASLFGLKKIRGFAALVNDGEANLYTGSPDYTGDSLLITAGDASGAISDLPNDTYSLIIEGTR